MVSWASDAIDRQNFRGFESTLYSERTWQLLQIFTRLNLRVQTHYVIFFLYQKRIEAGLRMCDPILKEIND